LGKPDASRVKGENPEAGAASLSDVLMGSPEKDQSGISRSLERLKALFALEPSVKRKLMAPAEIESSGVIGLSGEPAGLH
jgi:hypothetical protein